MGEDHNGSVSHEEAVKFGEAFIKETRGAKNTVEQAAQAMFRDVDENKDNKLSPDEWIHFFQRVIPADLTDAEFFDFFGTMKETVELSKKPVKWSVRVQRIFCFILVVQLAISIAMLALSVRQADDWSDMGSFLGLSYPNNKLRTSVSVLLLVNAVFGLVVGFKEIKTGVTTFGALGVAFAILNFISCALDAFLFADGEAKCKNACTEMNLRSCDCSYAWDYKNTWIISFVTAITTSIAAVIAVLYSTSWGESHYLGQWSDVFLRWSGVSTARRALVKRFWFAPPQQQPQQLP
eukprot:TRINITY_DN6631_c0_g3_i1.p1 TRINITY_DN6631_c0_g3~~TRINITY_DN6631_c0_g3_i1.p1  ORF type:complete len:303 (-),score=103.96 TRINITY_DN6631_c0_g3_i1:150-1028(-)